MNANQPDVKDAIRTIEDAINQAKSEKTGASFYYQLWGMILFAYFMLHYLLFVIPGWQGTFIDNLSWMLFPLGGLLSMIRKTKENKKETVVPHLEKVYFFAFTGLAMAYGTVFTLSIYLQSSLAIILYPMLLGLCIYIAGGITKHVPSIIGGVLGIIFTGFSLFASLDLQFLSAALASLFTCAIPGYLMKKSHV